LGFGAEAATAMVFAPAFWATARICTASPMSTSLSPSNTTGMSGCARISGRRNPSRSASETGVLLINTSFLGVTVITICRGSDLVSSTSGRLMFAPDCTMATLVTIKIISNTRKMSVSGVMLISAMMAELLPFFLRGLDIPMSFPPHANRFEHTVRGDRHRRLDALELGLKVVVEDDRNDSDGQPQSSRD